MPFTTEDLYKEHDKPLFNKIIEENGWQKDIQEGVKQLEIENELYFLKKRIGKQIKKHRKQNDLTKNELGNILKLKPIEIKKLEKGKLNISLKTLLTITNTLDLQVDIKQKEKQAI